MAITVEAAGTWAELTADGSVSRPGTPQAGDRYYVFAAWKDFSVTAQITSPEAWTEVTEFADGSVSTGANVGSVKVGAWYRDWQSGDSNPTLDFSAGVIAGAVAVLLRKGSSETWDTPLFVTAAIAAATTWSATSSSTLTVKDGALVLELTGFRDDSSTMTRSSTTALEDDGSPNVTWNGNVVETVATHFSTTTGNDLSADLIHRFVTTGAAGVNLTGTGTLSASETGAALWVHQGVTESLDKSGSGSTSTASSTSSTGRKGVATSPSASTATSTSSTGRKGVSAGATGISTSTSVTATGRKGSAGSPSAAAATSTSATGTAGRQGSPSFSVSSSTSATGSGGHSGSGSADVSSATSATGSGGRSGTASASVSSSVQLTGVTGRLDDATLSSSTSTAASGAKAGAATGSVTVATSTAAAGDKEETGGQPSGSGSFSVSTSTSATGVAGFRGSASLSATTSASSAGASARASEAAATVSTSLSATGAGARVGAGAVVSVVLDLLATGFPAGPPPLTQPGTAVTTIVGPSASSGVAASPASGTISVVIEDVDVAEGSV